MKVSCGTDIIEIERIKNAIERTGDKFLETVFTEQEIEYCEARKIQKYQHYAARFAAKEAAFKAVSQHVSKDGLDWKSFEVLRCDDGKPEINILANIQSLECIDLSISHCKQYATATVIAIFQ